jgi:G3E family GTPase
MENIPVNIISGFLGSGKTTAIIQLLRQKQNEERWAIVVNEFGKVSIDGQTLQSKLASGSVFHISGGCICCSAKGYLMENLVKIIEPGNFNRIIIEPTGLGGIEMISEIVETLPNLKIMPVICLVDILGLENQRLQRNMIYQAQIRKAERIILSKCDLLDSFAQQDLLVLKFKSIFPEMNFCIVGTQMANSILEPNSDHQNNELINAKINFVPFHHLTDQHFEENNLQIGAEQEIEIEALKAILIENKAIIRAKGYVHSKNGWILFNYTLTGFNFESIKAKEKNELVIIAEKLTSDFSVLKKKLTALFNIPNYKN